MVNVPLVVKVAKVHLTVETNALAAVSYVVNHDKIFGSQTWIIKLSYNKFMYTTSLSCVQVVVNVP